MSFLHVLNEELNELCCFSMLFSYVVALKVPRPFSQILSHVCSYSDGAYSYSCIELATESISNPHPPQPILAYTNRNWMFDHGK